MTLATVVSRALAGIEAPEVIVELHLGPGLPTCQGQLLIAQTKHPASDALQLRWDVSREKRGSLHVAGFHPNRYWRADVTYGLRSSLRRRSNFPLVRRAEPAPPGTRPPQLLARVLAEELHAYCRFWKT